jgi:hypothetical protein
MRTQRSPADCNRRTMTIHAGGLPRADSRCTWPCGGTEIGPLDLSRQLLPTSYSCRTLVLKQSCHCRVAGRVIAIHAYAHCEQVYIWRQAGYKKEFLQRTVTLYLRNRLLFQRHWKKSIIKLLVRPRLAETRPRNRVVGQRSEVLRPISCLLWVPDQPFPTLG